MGVSMRNELLPSVSLSPQRSSTRPIIATAMSPMPTVHKEVHQRAKQKEQPRQKGNQMGQVFGNQEKGNDSQENIERSFRRKLPPRSAWRVFVWVNHSNLIGLRFEI
jgi:hypothetical protein